jgi:uncharacterized protein YaaR (DUF327 family)
MSRVSRASGSLKGLFRKKKGKGAERKTAQKSSKGIKGAKVNVNINHSPFLDKLNEMEVGLVHEELLENLEDIKSLGAELAKNPTMQNYNLYKNKVRAFLSIALKKLYKVDNKMGLKKLGRDQKVYVSVEKLDKELEELTLEFIKEQEEAIYVLNKIEGIQGLLLNVLG